MNKCSKCKQEKTVNDFYKDRRTRSGLYSACKKCDYKYAVLRKKCMTEAEKILSRKKQADWMRKYSKTEKNIEYRKKYTKMEKYRLYVGGYIKNPKRKIDRNVGSLIWQAIKKRESGIKWLKLFDYSLVEFMNHLEKQFDNKMSWNNYGSYWHIDHIKPRSLFKFTTAKDQEFKECWALENLQPLEASANRKKGNKYELSNTTT